MKYRVKYKTSSPLRYNKTFLHGISTFDKSDKNAGNTPTSLGHSSVSHKWLKTTLAAIQGSKYLKGENTQLIPFCAYTHYLPVVSCSLRCSPGLGRDEEPSFLLGVATFFPKVTSLLILHVALYSI